VEGALPRPRPRGRLRLARAAHGRQFDGLWKYGRLLRPGEDPADVVVAEKLREDEIRDLDLRVVLWTWPDLDHFDAVVERLCRAFAGAS
jgi:hypothetical protein